MSDSRGSGPASWAAAAEERRRREDVVLSRSGSGALFYAGRNVNALDSAGGATDEVQERMAERRRSQIAQLKQRQSQLDQLQRRQSALEVQLQRRQSQQQLFSHRRISQASTDTAAVAMGAPKEDKGRRESLVDLLQQQRRQSLLWAARMMGGDEAESPSDQVEIKAWPFRRQKTSLVFEGLGECDEESMGRSAVAEARDEWSQRSVAKLSHEDTLTLPEGPKEDEFGPPSLMMSLRGEPSLASFDAWDYSVELEYLQLEGLSGMAKRTRVY
jgi:hypothetical protein